MGIRFFASIIALAAAYFTREIILLGFFSIVLAVLMSFPIHFFSRFFSRGISLAFTLLLIGGVLTGVVLFALPTISNQVDQLEVEIPKAAEKLHHWVIRAEKKVKMLPADAKEGSKTSLGLNSNNQQDMISSATQITSQAMSVLKHLVEGISEIIFVLVLAIFFSAQPKEYRDGLRRLMPHSRRGDFDELWRRGSRALRGWMGGIIIDMTIMGTLAGVGLWIAGIEDALVLGLLTFFATFVPYVGGILSAIPGIFMGLSKSPTHMFYAFLVYLFVHIVEGYIVGPLVMKQAVQLNPALQLFWQFVMGVLFGMIGIVVATPLLVCFQTFVLYAYVEGNVAKSSTGLDNF